MFRRYQVILVNFKLHKIFYRIFWWLISRNAQNSQKYQGNAVSACASNLKAIVAFISLALQIRDQHAARITCWESEIFGKWQLILFCWNLLDNEPNGNCLCEMSNLNQLTVVKSLVCNKLCKIYHFISDFIVERILYASKQTIRTDIFESNIESLLISLRWVRYVASSCYYSLLNIRNFFA